MLFLGREKKENPISLPLSECLAKSYRTKEKAYVPGRDVFSHCLIVGYVAKSLLLRMPKCLSGLYPPESALIAAVHDVGKICPTFQEKIRRGKNNVAGYKHNSYPGLEDANPEHEHLWGYHAGVSQLTLSYCQSKKYIPEIVGQHHGFSPPIERWHAHNSCFGGKSWQNQREILIQDLQKALKMDWPKIQDDKQARLVAGLTTVADWIGSSSLFDDPFNAQWMTDIEQALDQAGFVRPSIQKGLSFKDIFGCSPRPIQQQLVTACNQPGVYILEAPMGIGKTEAALYAAYKLLEADKASGIYFALPTQLTSDKIYERVQAFLQQIIPINSPHRSALLAHAHAKLKMTELGEEGSPGGSWFAEHKKELLAPFGVGTIDQALMAVMNVSHGFVRAFGLAGKVVILDEVHSYDAYTGTIIDALIEHLLNWKCTVLILSATLTESRRKALIQHTSHETLSTSYPLISANQSGKFSEITFAPDVDASVSIHLCNADDWAIEEALERAKNGQQVLWIENTVQEAQNIYRILAARSLGCNIRCGLLHSRFTRIDRAKIESEWIALYGKEGVNRRTDLGRILVGTQILEQSLDIDADFLISRLCPTDMFLQRIGRLWRHPHIRRPDCVKKREAWILTPTLEMALTDPETSLGKSYFIYAPYYLLRSLEVLNAVTDSIINLPGQMRSLIEYTYREREEQGIMKQLKLSLDKTKEKLQGLARIGLSQGGTTQSDEWAPTRYSEQDTNDVLLIQGLTHEKLGTHVRLMSGETLFLPRANASAADRKKLSLKLMQYIVKVSNKTAPDVSQKNELSWIKDYLYISNEEKSRLRIAKWMPSEELVSLDNHSFSSSISYNQILGYIAEGS